MVDKALKKKKSKLVILEPQKVRKEEIQHTSIKLSSVFANGARLEASAFSIEGLKAKKKLELCKWDLATVTGENGLATAYHCLRFKRIYTEKSGIPFFQPSQIVDIHPKANKYISEKTKTNIPSLKVSKGQVLMTCSGTIGKMSFVSKSLDGKVFSHDLIRINGKGDNDAGFIYTFFQTKIGQSVLITNNYGTTVEHIEPEHLNRVPIPNPDEEIKKRIHNLIVQSFDLRDESNELIELAQSELVKVTCLPKIEEIKPDYLTDSRFRNYQVKLSDVNFRFEGSYHVPIARKIVDLLKSSEQIEKVVNLGDESISDNIYIGGRFKRVYVNEGQGVTFISGKSITELNPSNKKYISFTQHENRIKSELELKEDTMLITCSGTLGKIAFVPKHWEGWVATHDLVRLFPSDKSIAGYLFAWLTSDYGQQLIKRLAYGSVVDHIEVMHVKEIPVPILKDKSKQKEINDLVLRANKLRYEAYLKEEEAIKIMEDEVINKIKEK